MTTATDHSGRVLIDALRAEVEAALQAVPLPDEPSSLYAPIRYVLEGGGKRFRPVLVLLAAEALGAERRQALPAALAVEIFHNFTLVHDDIMDHAQTRRGRDTVHARWDDATAVLSGDFMLALSYRLLADAPPPLVGEMLRVFDRMVQRLCEGQALDKHFETLPTIALNEYIAMIDAKTGALLEASLELGAITAGAGESNRLALRQIGCHVGRAFQIQDDLLDLVADDHRWGKAVGGDLMEGKKTFLLVRVLERATGQDLEFFRQVVANGGLAAERIPEARSIMDRVGVLDEARDAVSEHTETALALIGSLPGDSPAKNTLLQMVDGLRIRPH